MGVGGEWRGCGAESPKWMREEQQWEKKSEKRIEDTSHISRCWAVKLSDTTSGFLTILLNPLSIFCASTHPTLNLCLSWPLAKSKLD